MANDPVAGPADSVVRPDVNLAAQAVAPTGREVDLGQLGELLRDRVEFRSLAITGLLVLACLYTIYFARAFVLPVVLAVLLDFLFSPVIRALNRLHVPNSVGAALVVLGLLGSVSGILYEVSGPAQEWMAKAPASLARIESKLRVLRRPVEQVSQTAEKMAEATNVSGKAATRTVVVQGPSVASKLFGTTREILVGLFEVVVLLFFLLAAGDLFLQKLIKVLPLLRDKKKAVAIARETEASISTYLYTITLINVGEGIAIGLAMYAVGLPNAALWGVLAALLEFIPYVGAVIMFGMLTLAGFVTFDTLGRAMIPPLVYLVVNFFQSNVFSPMILGRRLTLNPVAIFIGFVFWLWMWGIPGGFIAVPLLATFKIFCDHIESLAPIGEFLGK
jgi:predicted PurR-regulated permease PerM